MTLAGAYFVAFGDKPRIGAISATSGGWCLVQFFKNGEWSVRSPDTLVPVSDLSGAEIFHDIDEMRRRVEARSRE